MTISISKFGQAQAPAAPKERKPNKDSHSEQDRDEAQRQAYGAGVRQQVFEVVVRQALAGAPWREICAGPMQVNRIDPEEVEAEVRRRRSLF